MKGVADLVARLEALPPDGVDLRAEVGALQSARVSQALAQSGGDLGKAAMLLRMSRLDLLRLETRLAGPGPRALELIAADVPRIERGVEVISAAVIRRLALEGLTDRQIANRLGVNPYVVEKVLRPQIKRDVEVEVRRLDAEGWSVGDIAAELTIERARVRRILRFFAEETETVVAPGEGK